MKKILQNLLTEGKTTQVFTELRTLTAFDANLNKQVIGTAARFAELEEQIHAGTLDHTPSVFQDFV